MKIRVDRRIADYAGSGLVMIALLVGAMAVSSLPALVQALNRPHAAVAAAAAEPAP